MCSYCDRERQRGRDKRKNERNRERANKTNTEQEGLLGHTIGETSMKRREKMDHDKKKEKKWNSHFLTAKLYKDAHTENNGGSRH